MSKSSFTSFESGIGHGDYESSAVEDFFNKFVPQLSSLARKHNDELLEDPTVDFDALAVCQSAPQKKVPQPTQQVRHQSHRQKMIMAENTSGNSSSGCESGRDLSMDEISLIVGQLKDGGPYSEKLITIMLKGLEKTLTGSVYKLFLESGLPANWCPIVKMNSDNTPYVEFLIKADISDQDPASQLREYSPGHMAMCQFVLKKLHQSATYRQSPQVAAPPPAKRPTSLLHRQRQQLQQKQPQQQQQQQPQRQQQQQQQQQSHHYQHLQQKQSQTMQPSLDFGTPLACSTPKSQRQRILPPRACKSARNDQTY